MLRMEHEVHLLAVPWSCPQPEGTEPAIAPARHRILPIPERDTEMLPADSPSPMGPQGAEHGEA